MKSKRGNIFFGVIIGFLVFFAGVLILPYLTDSADYARTNLQCTNMNISDGTKFTCLIQDMTIPYYIWFFVSLAIAILMGNNL